MKSRPIVRQRPILLVHSLTRWLTHVLATIAAMGITAASLAQPANAQSRHRQRHDSRRLDSRRQAIARVFAREPTIQQIRQHALRAYGYGGADLDQWSSRARWSHLLPEVQGEVDWLDQKDSEARYREDIDTTDTGRMRRDSAQNDFIVDGRIRTIYAVKLQWDLSGLVYDKSEAAIAREVRRRRQARQELLEAVGEAYYRRRRYLTEWLLTPESQWRKRLDVKLKADRQTARIDAMTRGWFSRTLGRARKKRPRPSSETTP